MKSFLVVTIKLSDAEYSEARQFFSREEIKDILKNDGLNELRNKVAMAVAASRRMEW